MLEDPRLLCGTLSPPDLGQLFWASKIAPLPDPSSVAEKLCARPVTPSNPIVLLWRQWDTFLCAAASLICLCCAIFIPLVLDDVPGNWLDQKTWHIRGLGLDDVPRQKGSYAHLELWRPSSPEEKGKSRQRVFLPVGLVMRAFICSLDTQM